MKGMEMMLKSMGVNVDELKDSFQKPISELNAAFAAINAKLDSISSMIVTMDAKIDAIESKVKCVFSEMNVALDTTTEAPKLDPNEVSMESLEEVAKHGGNFRSN